LTGPRAADGRTSDPVTFRSVLGRFATGVAVMTTSRDGVPHAMTANAVSSVSLEPPLVLVCVERDAVMAREVEATGAFALTFLGADQAALSTRFSDPDRPMGAAQFEGVATWAAETGSPVLEGGIGWVDCRVWNRYDGGDHIIVVGEVATLGVGADDDPLLYYGSTYGRWVS
jgi:flavin reductase